HAQAKVPEETDWAQIAELYRALAAIHPSAVVSLNHAVAVAMSQGLETGLRLIEELRAGGELDSYHLYHAARADLLRRMGERRRALEEYRRALSLTTNAVERRYLRRRMTQLEAPTA